MARMAVNALNVRVILIIMLFQVVVSKSLFSQSINDKYYYLNCKIADSQVVSYNFLNYEGAQILNLNRIKVLELDFDSLANEELLSKLPKCSNLRSLIIWTERDSLFLGSNLLKSPVLSCVFINGFKLNYIHIDSSNYLKNVKLLSCISKGVGSYVFINNMINIEYLKLHSIKEIDFDNFNISSSLRYLDILYLDKGYIDRYHSNRYVSRKRYNVPAQIYELDSLIELELNFKVKGAFKIVKLQSLKSLKIQDKCRKFMKELKNSSGLNYLYIKKDTFRSNEKVKAKLSNISFIEFL